RTAQKVRLIHAVIRKYLTSAATSKSMASGQVPISQRQLVGTLMTFSVAVVEGLRGLGFPVTPEDADARDYLWSRVGLLLGIEERFLPPTYDDGKTVLKAMSRLWEVTWEGRRLAEVTLGLLRDLLPEFPELGPALVRKLVPPKCANVLGIHAPDPLT